jgi:hypothetical protein
MSTATLLNPFKVYVPTERDIVGMVSEIIPNGTLRFIPRTISKFKSGVNQAIGVILTNNKGESTTLPCSKAVSKSIVEAIDNGSVTKADALAIVAGLEITQFVHNKTNEIVQIISAPATEGTAEESIDITRVALAKHKVAYEDLI